MLAVRLGLKFNKWIDEQIIIKIKIDSSTVQNQLQASFTHTDKYNS